MAVSVGQIEQLIERIAPRSWADEWDNSGLLVGSSAQRVEKVLLTLDASMEVVDEAVQMKADLVIAHHPLMLKPIKSLRLENQGALLPLALFRHGISYYAAHTNLDKSELSASKTFAQVLGLEKTEFLDSTAEKLVKIVTFVPEEDAEAVRKALAAEGVGAGITDGEHSDNYAECFYQLKGEGMFRPLQGADPTIGNIGELTRVAEIRMESIVEERSLARAVKALHRAHPYEEPAYDLIPLLNTGKHRGYGMIGYLPEPMSLGEVWETFKERMAKNSLQAEATAEYESVGIERRKIFPCDYDLSSIRIAGDMKKKIRKVAISNGSGSSFVQKAVSKGADLFITGDIGYHGVLDSLEAGMAVGELGHFLSEIPMIQSLSEYIRGDKTMDDVEIVISIANKVPWNTRG